MKPRRSTQPYRKNRPRPTGRTLSAMLRGEPANRPHPMNATRKLRKQRKAVRAAVRRGRRA